MSAVAPDEALEEAARLAREQAPALCRRDAATGTSCDWHHGLWPTLRLLGLATAPALHGEFLRTALAGVAGIAARHAGAAVLVFTHGGVLEMVHRHAHGTGISAPRDFEIPNAALNWIEIGPQHWRVRAWAQVAHLERALDDLPD